MKIRVELSDAEVETAIAEYLQRTLSTGVASAEITECVSGAYLINVELSARKKQGGTTRCSACGGFGHNVATCTGPRPEATEEDPCKPA